MTATAVHDKQQDGFEGWWREHTANWPPDVELAFLRADVLN